MNTVQSVLIIDDLPQSLATVRALSQSGYCVYIARRYKRSAAERSRYAGHAFHLVTDDTKVMTDQLNTFLLEHPEVCCLLPLGEQSIANVQHCAPNLKQRIPIAAVDVRILETCKDKMRTNDVALLAGVRVPASALARTYSELTLAISSIGYPLILKSPNNEALINGNKALILENEAALKNLIPQWPSGHSALLIQQFVKGEVVGCDFVAFNGSIVAYYQGNLQRTDRLDGTGFGVEFCSVKPEPKLFTTLEKLIGFMKYTGPGLLQCVRCEKTDELYFIEINPRLSAGIADPLNAGIDLPSAAVNAARGLLQNPIRSHKDVQFRYSVASYWFERDLRGWLDQRRHLSTRESLRWLTQMVKAYATCDAHINWRWRDPVPSFYIFARLARTEIRNRQKRSSS